MAERYCKECGQVFCLPCARQELVEFLTCARCGPDKIEEQENGEWLCTECEEPAQGGICVLIVDRKASSPSTICAKTL